MTILFITRKFPPSTGGMERFAFDLYTALSSEANIVLVKWGGSNKYLPVVLPYFMLRASWLLLTRRIDVVHVHDGVLAPLGYVLGQLFRRPFTVQIHGLDVTYKNKLFQQVNIGCLRRASRIFSISQAATDEAIKRHVPERLITRIPLGITDDLHATRNVSRTRLRHLLQLAADTPVVLTVGRLVKRKGVAWFVGAAMPKLVKQYPKLCYAVVGTGADAAAIQHAVHAYGLAHHVRLLGHVSDDELPAFYNGADIFVQPNIVVPGDMEGFGRVLLEASLCQLPVVATGIEGIRDAIQDGENGLLVPEEQDAAGFVRRIDSLLNDQAAARAFGAKSRSYTLKHFNWQHIARQYIATYEQLTRPR